jgi:site-specific recombinase XerD
MTELRKRFIDDMQLRGFSESTIEAYVRSVRQLTQHFHKSPDIITEADLRQYFLYNKNIRKWSRAASTISLCGIKFFFTHTLQKEWTTFKLVRPPKENKLPPILSKVEVRRIFDHVRQNYHRVCLIAIYSLGLRLQEATHLHVADIDSDRMFVHIHQGKGAKDRYVPLPHRTLEILKDHWKTHRNPQLLFPAPGRGQIHMPYTDKPLPKASIQIPFKQACQKAKIYKQVSVHHLRHAYAVHLLEAGVDLRFVQEYLGHSDPRTTMIYTRLINKALPEPVNIINRVMADL